MAIPAPRSATPWRVRVSATTTTISGPGLRATDDGAFSLQGKDAGRLLEVLSAALSGVPVRASTDYRLDRSPENRLTFRPAWIPAARAVPVVEVVLPRAAAVVLLARLRSFVGVQPPPRSERGQRNHAQGTGAQGNGGGGNGGRGNGGREDGVQADSRQGNGRRDGESRRQTNRRQEGREQKNSNSKARNAGENPVCPRRGCTGSPYDPLSGLCRQHYGQNRQYIRFVSAGAFGSGR
jgi:hypothetical protein